MGETKVCGLLRISATPKPRARKRHINFEHISFFRGFAKGVSRTVSPRFLLKMKRKKKNGKKRKKTEKNGKNRKRHRSGDPFCETPIFESWDNPGTTRRLTRGKSLYFLCFEVNT